MHVVGMKIARLSASKSRRLKNGAREKWPSVVDD